LNGGKRSSLRKRRVSLLPKKEKRRRSVASHTCASLRGKSWFSKGKKGKGKEFCVSCSGRKRRLLTTVRAQTSQRGGGRAGSFLLWERGGKEEIVFIVAGHLSRTGGGGGKCFLNGGKKGGRTDFRALQGEIAKRESSERTQQYFPVLEGRRAPSNLARGKGKEKEGS